MVDRETFDEDKFRELLLYVASKCSGLSKFGSTKLNKILFFSDFLCFANFGAPITGATYQKLQWGPAPRQYLPVLRGMMERGEAAIEHRGVYRKQKRLVALRDPNLTLFSGPEIALVDSVIDALREHTAIEASDLSHEEARGWQIVEEGDDIPYSTVFVACDPLTADDVRWAQEFAAEHGYMES